VVMENIQHPTTNIEHPMPVRSQAHWMLVVRCWMLDVSFQCRISVLFNVFKKAFRQCPGAA